MINILEVSLFFLFSFGPLGAQGVNPGSPPRSLLADGLDLLSALRLSSAWWIGVQGVPGCIVGVFPQRVANPSPLSGFDFLLDVLLVGPSVSTGLHD